MNNVGGNPFNNLKIETQDVQKVMVGTNLVWQREDTTPTPTGTFTSTWDTQYLGSADAITMHLALPLVATGTYDFIVDWGDGTTNRITTYDQQEVVHTYTSSMHPVYYTVKITGTIEGWSFNNSGNRVALTEITEWGPLRLGNEGDYFYGCENLNLANVSDVLDLTGTTNLLQMFRGCISLTTVNRINEWDTSSVTYMTNMFNSATSFNQPLNNWITTSVKDMGGMFINATAFDQNIGMWNVSNVTNLMYFMSGKTPETFSYQNLDAIYNGWSQLSLKSSLSFVDFGTAQYSRAGQAGRDILTGTYGWTITDGGLREPTFTSVWDTRLVSEGSSASNQISLAYDPNVIGHNFTVDWGDGTQSSSTEFGVDAHTYATEGIYTISITGTIKGWYFGNGGDRLKILEVLEWGPMQFSSPSEGTQVGTGGTFEGCENLVLSNVVDTLDLTDVFSLQAAFKDCLSLTTINHIEQWDVSYVTSLDSTFYNTPLFNQPLNNWNTSSVTNMSYMFSGATSFNQPLNNWDTSMVTDMSNMFSGAIAFDQNIGNWNVSSVRYDTAATMQVLGFTGFMETKTSETFSYQNLDAIYNGWSQLTTLSSGEEISFGTAMYSEAGQAGRDILTGTYSWVITDGGKIAYSGPPPTAATNIQVSNIGEHSFDLSWTAGEYVDEYVVEQSENNGSFSDLSAPTANTTITITDLSSGYTAEYRVRSNNLGLDKAYSEIVTVTTLAMGPATNITASSITETSLVLDWDAGLRADYHVVERRKVGSNEWVAVFDGYDTPSVTQITETNLQHNTSYEYIITSMNYNDNLIETPRVRSELYQVTTLLGTVTAPSIHRMDLATTSLTPHWMAGEYVDYYSVEYKRSADTTWIVDNPNTTALTEEITGLTMGTSYDIIVIAHNVGGTAASSIWTTSTLSNTMTPATNLSATNIAKTTLTLNWTSGVDTENFDVLAKPTSSSTWVEKASMLTTTSANITGLTQETSYDFKVISRNSLGTMESAIYTVSTHGILYMVPAADVDVGDWTTPPLWSTVETPGDSSNWISSSNANGSTCRLRFTVPSLSGPGTLKLYRRKTTGNDPQFIWTLYQGATQVQTNTLTLTSTTFLLDEYPLTANLVAGATYEIELTRSGGGSPSQRGILDMAAIWIEY